ncbi:hypothetical protein KCV87_23345 [Actinosynnema pretiosum subsp. pretiosum]|uniref:Uncharacterized protein n=2 Tax=Actinosynnema TaxID=40566 RepID=C6WLU3_ACTMD|nr:hypothetical protein [Actinosynnema mirum]ACU40328.1 hypothetical protein Amir_6528 [Actinosynnema mirum DSM 43827]AXX33838.1 hypothetical protein APASM_6473 [Actinosynnema pretiosum subsp. pretiosum]QUF02400.1 hypothetical protein KCV87_23345 [Actinosynnema pretiosum subsp. pretiosum]
MSEHEVRERRPGIDVVSLVFGVTALIASAYMLTDGSALPGLDLRWLLAGGALVIGLGLLGSSVRRRQ